MIEKNFTNDLFDFQEELKIFLAWFIARPEHKWLRTEYSLMDSLIEVFERLSVKELGSLMEKQNIRVVPRSESSHFARIHRGRVIEISENLADEYDHLMISSVLCREVGKVLLNKSRSSQSEVELEIAADRFAVSKGFAREVENLLLQESEGMEKRLRLVYLTSLVIREELS